MPEPQPPCRCRGPGHAKITAGRFLLSARWVVPVEPAGAVLEHHTVALRDGTIEQVLPSSEALRKFPDYENVELPDHVLMPGLVNAHAQAATSLMRGLPAARKAAAEERLLSADFVRDGTALACADMLLGGITCFNDTYFFAEAALDAALEAGMRVSLGLIVSDVPTAYASDPADYRRKGLGLRDRLGERALVSFALAPQSLSDSGLKHIATLAAELDLPVHVRVDRPGEVERLYRLGLLGPSLAAVHASALEPVEIDLLARHGCSVVQDRGFLLKSGVGLALAADSERFDLFAAMRAGSLPAHAALHAATFGGARALGLSAQIGSIVPGKRADLVALAVRGPCHDAIRYVVHVAGREDVTHVWVDGALRVRDARLETHASRLDSRWQIWQNALESRADS